VTEVGAYRRTFTPEFKSVFVFGRLDGPLFILEFAEVTDVTLSFGYNYNIRSPEAGSVDKFPLLAPSEGGKKEGNPMEMLIGTGDSSFSSWRCGMGRTRAPSQGGRIAGRLSLLG
jgi:hypothetical protein